MKSINKNATGPLGLQYQRTMKLSKGCHNRQPFSFAKITMAISYNKILMQKQSASKTMIPSCFTNQTENPEKALITPKKNYPKPVHSNPVKMVVSFCPVNW